MTPNISENVKKNFGKFFDNYRKSIHMKVKELRKIIKEGRVKILFESEGVEYYLELHIANGQTFRFNDELPGEEDQFSYIIYDWIRNNVFENYATMDDESETELTFTIKLTSVPNFQAAFKEFLNSKGFDITFNPPNKLYGIISQKKLP